MLKKFNMFALIVLLVFQTMIAPIAATAQEVEVEPESTEVEDLDTTEATPEEGDLEEEPDESAESDEGAEVVEDESEGDEEEAIEPDESEDGDSEAEVTEEPEEKSDEKDGTEVEVDVEEEVEESASVTHSASERAVITENIIGEILLKREDGSEYKDGDQLDPNEDLELGLEWSLPEGPEYIGGDTFKFQLPEQLAIYSEITGDLDDYGTFVVTTDGEVTFTFNDKINENSNVKGTFWVKTELDKQKITSSTEELEIVLNEDVAKKITIHVKPEGGQAIHKEGQPVGGNFNTDEIQWTVLINTTKDELENAIVNDPILDGQELDLDSIKLQEIEVNLAGEKVGEIGPVDLTDIDKSTDGELKLELGNTNKAYELTFKTKIKDSEKDEEGWKGYANTAYLNSDGKDQKKSGASVSVQWPESLVKNSRGFNAKDRSVEWEVKANFTEKLLKKDDEIVDEFTFTIGGEDRSDAFEILNEDIKIEQVDGFKNNGEVDGTTNAKGLFDITIDGNKVTYKLKEDTNKAFIIKYKTKAKDGAIIDNNGEISNTVTIDGNTETSNQGVHQQVGDKWNHEINYDTKEIEWRIRVNADEQTLNNFVLTDDFSGSGQKLVENSIEIDPDTSNAQISPNANGEGFEINFGTITESYLITYKTKFTYDFEDEKTPNFKNGINITYDTGDPDNGYELEKEVEVGPNEETKNNGVKNGTANNETKEITWKIDVNYNKLKLTDAKVIDEIADNQSLVDGSVVVYETSIDSDGNITTGDDVTENVDVTAEENLVEVSFNGGINKSHRIEFKTIDKDGIYNSDEVYKNSAKFIPREEEEHNLTASVTLPNQGEYLGKSGLHNKEDWTVDWTIDVNKSQSKLTDVTVTDDLGDDGSQILLADSFKVTKADSNEELAEDAYKLTIDGNTFSIKFPGEITDAYQIKYSSYILAGETADLKNEAEITSVEEEIVGNVEKEEEVEVKISTGGGTAEGATGGLTLEKTEKDTNRALEGVKFTLTKKIGEQEIVVREGTTDADGKIEWTGLKYGDYTLKENIPEGYTGRESQEVTINNDSLEDGILTLKDDIVNARQTGTAKIVKTDAVTGEKLSGASFEITNETTGQKYSLTTNDDGTISEEVPYGEYTVEEFTAPNGYKTIKNIKNITIGIDETTEIFVKNEAIVDVTGEKTWHTSEDQESLAAITVELLANGSKIDEQEVGAADEWKYSFTDLDKYDETGEEIDYSIVEVDVDGYDSQTDGYDLTNIQLIDLSGTKIWDEVDNQYRPASITVNLLANGEEVASEIVPGEADENKWAFSFSDLPKYGTDGEEIEYTLEEVSHEGYSSEVDHETNEITNTQKTTEITVEKTWQDDDDATKDRPKSITLQVKNGDKVVKEQEVTTDEDWAYTFTDLPKYDEEGTEIAYTVDEKDVPEGYTKSVDGNEVTNTRTGTTEVDITKHWEDEHETDRPDEITVNLLQNGTFFEEHTVTKDNGWKLKITDLQAFDEEGKAYEYTVTEHDVAGYEVEIDGFDITNTRTDKKDIEITKTWEEKSETFRPDGIEVELFRSTKNGDKEKVDTYKVLAKDDWKLAIKDLDSFDKKGKAYTYEIAEKAVEEYNTTIRGFDITNTQKTYAIGDYTWIDRNKDGIQDENEPVLEGVIVELYDKDDKKIAETTTDENGRYIFDELEAGDYQIKFELTEEQAKKYKFTQQNAGDDTTVDSDADPDTGWTKDITLDDSNEYLTKEYEDQDFKATEGIDPTWDAGVIELVHISGKKTWLDDDSADRPGEITVYLLANGKETDQTVTVAADADWKYAFNNLDKYDHQGEEIAYTVDEEVVDGYEAMIEDFDITNLRVGETEVEVTKSWKDDNETDRPDTIKVNLLQNGDFYKEYEVTAENDWKLTISDLPKYDDQGKAYEYTVTEHDVPGYASEIDGFDITNTRTDKKDIEITKTWLDDDAKDRPDTIEVELFRSVENGERELVEVYELTATDNWKLEIKELQSFDENGKAYTYEIDEKPVEGYESTINGFDITNLRVGETSVAGTKTWKDTEKDNRPSSITIELLQNGEKIDEVKVTAKTDWKYSFADLDAFDENGVAYEYTVQEQGVIGYTASIDGYDITNTSDTYLLGSGGEKDDDSQVAGEGDRLADTATNIYNLSLIGFGLILTGLILFFIRRKKTE